MKPHGSSKRVKHLKNNNGSWAYRRRVPERHHKTLGFKVWNRPCGDVSYQQAVVMVTNWTSEDDLLIESLDDPSEAAKVRYETEAARRGPSVERLLDAMKHEKEHGPVPVSITDENGNEHFFEDGPLYSLQHAKDDLEAIDTDQLSDDSEKLVKYQNVLKVGFGPLAEIPVDLDDRDDFDLVKRKLERRIADLAGDPNTIGAVAERYYRNNQIKPGVLRKYRGNIRKLIDCLGDIPISHVTPMMLRRFRDQEAATLKPSALASVFTPIRGMFTHALEEELITANPILNVKLQKDKRSVHERKWTPFPPKEMRRLLGAMDDFWGKSMRGLSDERRLAVHMVCRVMAYSAMRPIEVVKLEPEDVSNDWIKVRESKTPSSYRTIPLHPNIADFAEFVANGGLHVECH